MAMGDSGDGPAAVTLPILRAGQNGFVLDEVGVVVATIGLTYGADEMRRLARLFAAAPELLDALRKCENWFTRYTDLGSKPEDTHEIGSAACLMLARLALAKVGAL